MEIILKRMKEQERGKDIEATMLSEFEYQQLVAVAIRQNMESLYSIGLLETNLAHELKALIPNLISLVEVLSNVGILIEVKEPTDRQIQCIFFVVDKIMDLEDFLWSSSLGLKGQVDIVVNGHMEIRVYSENMIFDMDSFRSSPLSAQKGSSLYTRLMSPLLSERLYSLLAPIEIKTGAWKSASALGHRAQVVMSLQFCCHL
jgi:hypothetical protein